SINLHWKLKKALLLFGLCVSGWISASVSQTQTVKVQPGENVMLQCSNRSSYQTYSFWSRLNKTQSSCISSLYDSENNVLFCDGFENDKYEVKTNISTIFLTINKVDVSDSGLYFCGIHVAGHAILTAIDLIVEGKDLS
uniref:Ig-like domain-containing protein n=1 Tax=Echeneis naucrates TaxID=173247 RepID=A0A665VIW5_ECHNA